MEDEAVIAELVQVRGIGRWTAEMFLMFCLLRPNVLPLDDLGLQRAICLNYFRAGPSRSDDAQDRLRSGIPGVRSQPGISGAASIRSVEY